MSGPRRQDQLADYDYGLIDQLSESDLGRQLRNYCRHRLWSVGRLAAEFKVSKSTAHGWLYGSWPRSEAHRSGLKKLLADFDSELRLRDTSQKQLVTKSHVHHRANTENATALPNGDDSIVGVQKFCILRVQIKDLTEVLSQTWRDVSNRGV
ncbi:MAG TPA: hypothetical protein PLZ57_01605 [Pseudobdellovibrionaceae bacterium]|nr:hypothetical protein [Pseudobdellovibrionaceae bacterium]